MAAGDGAGANGVGQGVGQANLAFYYATGPVHVYVRIPATGLTFFTGLESLGGQILFLGHAEDSPEPNYDPQYIPVISSLGGPAVEEDELFVGGKTQVSVQFSRFSWNVMQLLMASPMYGRGAPPGAETFLDRGRFVVQNGDGIELWLRNAFFGTVNAAAYPDLPIGTYFPCVRIQHTYPRKLSRDYTRFLVNFKALSVRRGVVGGYITYSQDPKWFAKLPLPG